MPQSVYQCFLSSIIVAVRKGWLPTFEKGGCPCSEMVVVAVRKTWSPHAVRSICSCHEEYLLMPCGWLAHAMRKPPFPNVVHHPFRTSTTMVSERRQPPFPNTAVFNLKTCPRPVFILSIFQSNFAVHSYEIFISNCKSRQIFLNGKEKHKLIFSILIYRIIFPVFGPKTCPDL